MAFSSSFIGEYYNGLHHVKVYSWVATGVTSGNIDTGMRIKYTIFVNKTAQRGTVDDTTTDGRVALTGLTAGDKGYVEVHGY